MQQNLQFNGLVPVDDVAGQTETLDVDNVDVAALGADVEPLALERQVEAGNPVESKVEWIKCQSQAGRFFFLSFHRQPTTATAREREKANFNRSRGQLEHVCLCVCRVAGTVVSRSGIRFASLSRPRWLSISSFDESLSLSSSVSLNFALFFQLSPLHPITGEQKEG